MIGERYFITRDNSDKILREAGEGRFGDQCKDTSIELVNDGATTIFNFLLYQGLVREA